MRRLLWVFVVFALGFGAAALLPRLLNGGNVVKAPDPDVRTVVERLREVARLESLRINVHKKVSFEQEQKKADSTWGDVANWVKDAVRPVKGKAIVFGVVHMGVDVDKVDARLEGHTLLVVLPDAVGHVELKPEETEIISEKNLDAAQVAQMLALAKAQMEHDVLNDPVMKNKARASAERALRAFLSEAAVVDVKFVPVLPPVASRM